MNKKKLCFNANASSLLINVKTCFKPPSFCTLYTIIFNNKQIIK